MAVFEMCMPEKYLLQGYGPAETPTQEGDSDSAVAETCDHCLLRKNDLCLGINADISKEGAPYFYRKKEITVLSLGDDTAQCMIYLLEPSETCIPPTVRYITAIAEGYLLHGLPVEPLLASAQDKDAPLMAFVYGTLKRGGRLHENMSGFEFAGEATVPGRLLNCGWYPGLVEGDAGEVVHGELYRVADSRDTEELVTRLDAIEGFSGYGQPNLYDRRVLTATDATGRTHPCWTYWWMGSRELPTTEGGRFVCE